MKFNSIANNFRDELRDGATHSSGVADAAAHSPLAQPKRRIDTSYSARRAIENGRQAVASYQYAAVRHDYRREARVSMHNTEIAPNQKPQTYGTNRPFNQRPVANSPYAKRQQQNAAGVQHTTSTSIDPHSAARVGFVEPSPRKYNPFG